jgi:hypothetical protein
MSLRNPCLQAVKGRRLVRLKGIAEALFVGTEAVAKGHETQKHQVACPKEFDETEEDFRRDEYCHHAQSRCEGPHQLTG